jgi:hypothetical protein
MEKGDIIYDKLSNVEYKIVGICDGLIAVQEAKELRGMAYSWSVPVIWTRSSCFYSKKEVTLTS